MTRPWLDAYKGIVLATIPGATEKNFIRSSYINRMNWRERMDKDATFTAPFYVWHFGKPVESPDWSPLDGDAFMLPVDLYGIFESTDPNASMNGNGVAPFDVVTYADNCGLGFLAGLNAYSGGEFQLMPGTRPVCDVSDTMESNKIFLVQGTDMWGFCVSAQLLVGTTN